jgi:class 3 adenylate cyclase
VVFGAERLDEIRAVLTDLGGADLPVLSPMPAPAPSVPPPPPAESQYVVAVMSGAERKGTWRAKSQINAISVMGGCKLDFRHAELSSAVTRVSAVTIMGSVEIVVPEGVPVEVDGFVLMGGIEDKTRAAPAPGAPMLRVTAFGMMGGVVIRHPRRRTKDRPHRSVGAPVEPESHAPESHAPVPLEGVAQPTLTLLCARLTGSTAMAEALGDQGWFQVLHAHGAVLRREFDAHGGDVIRAQGDGFLVSFPSVRQALSCAIAVQRALVTHRISDSESDIHVRIGLHSGEVIAAEGGLFGRNVDVATSLVEEAATDEILVSTLTKQLADAGGDLRFGPGRPTELGGLSGEWTVHDLRWS